MRGGESEGVGGRERERERIWICGEGVKMDGSHSLVVVVEFEISLWW